MMGRGTVNFTEINKVRIVNLQEEPKRITLNAIPYDMKWVCTVKPGYMMLWIIGVFLFLKLILF